MTSACEGAQSPDKRVVTVSSDLEDGFGCPQNEVTGKKRPLISKPKRDSINYEYDEQPVMSSEEIFKAFGTRLEIFGPPDVTEVKRNGDNYCVKSEKFLKKEGNVRTYKNEKKFMKKDTDSNKYSAILKTWVDAQLRKAGLLESVIEARTA